MAEQKRRKYSQDFKTEAVRLVTEQGYGISEAARNLGIGAGMLGRWKREAAGSQAVGAADNGLITQDLEAENKRLRRENERLQMEREILKKAAAFFAKESE